MTTATAAPPSGSPKTYPALVGLLDYVQPGQKIVMTGVKFSDYERLVDDRTAAGRSGVKIAFSDGVMEIVVVSGTHERLKKVVALLIQGWIAETGGEYVAYGGMTHKRADIERGFEPDECFYVRNWRAGAGVRNFDFANDPPPDLLVEIEVSRSAFERFPVYAAFHVPEVWRYDGTRLTPYLLQTGGNHQEVTASAALPTLPLAELPRFLSMASDLTVGCAEIDRQFRAWVRSLPQAAPNP